MNSILFLFFSFFFCSCFFNFIHIFRGKVLSYFIFKFSFHLCGRIFSYFCFFLNENNMFGVVFRIFEISLLCFVDVFLCVYNKYIINCVWQSAIQLIHDDVEHFYTFGVHLHCSSQHFLIANRWRKPSIV